MNTLSVGRIHSVSFPQKLIFSFLMTLVIVFALTLSTMEGWSSLSALCAIIFLCLFYLYSGSFYFLKIQIPLVLFVVYCFLTLLWGGSFDYAQLVATAIIVGMAVLTGLKTKAVSLEVVVFALLMSGLINILSSSGNMLTASNADDFRAEGMMGNPNAVAFVLSFTAFLILYVPLKFPKVIKLVGLFFLVYTFLFTGSRKGLLIVLMTLGYGFFTFWKSMDGPLKKVFRWFFIIAAVIGTAFVFIKAVPYLNDFGQDISIVARTQQMFSGSYNIRYDMIGEGFRLWKENPLFGWGAGQFAQMTIFQTYAHNNYIETLANFGLIGFVLYYSFYFYLIKKAVQRLKMDPKNSMAASKCSAGLMMLIMCLISEWGLVTLGLKSAWIVLMIAAFLILNEDNPETAL